MVGDVVHFLHSGTCIAALIVRVDDGGTRLRKFIPERGPDPEMYEPYVSLKSARPTSGWHWPSEHTETGKGAAHD